MDDMAKSSLETLGGMSRVEVYGMMKDLIRQLFIWQAISAISIVTNVLMAVAWWIK
jgi:hypothetical protein